MNTQIDGGMDRETISALMDGQLGGFDLARALRGMDADEARQCWLLYHTIGDVLRTPELAQCGRDGGAFVSRLSQRLSAEAASPAQAEAVVPTPGAARDLSRPAANDGVFRWKMVAGLSTFAAVAAIGWGAWGMLGSFGPQGGAPKSAQLAALPVAGSAPQAVALASAAPPPAPAASAVPAISIAAVPAVGPDAAPVMLRDPRLDELLAAHRAAAGASALGNQAGFLRNATFEGAGR